MFKLQNNNNNWENIYNLGNLLINNLRKLVQLCKKRAMQSTIESKNSNKIDTSN